MPIPYLTWDTGRPTRRKFQITSIDDQPLGAIFDTEREDVENTVNMADENHSSFDTHADKWEGQTIGANSHDGGDNEKQAAGGGAERPGKRSKRITLHVYPVQDTRIDTPRKPQCEMRSPGPCRGDEDAHEYFTTKIEKSNKKIVRKTQIAHLVFCFSFPIYACTLICLVIFQDRVHPQIPKVGFELLISFLVMLNIGYLLLAGWTRTHRWNHEWWGRMDRDHGIGVWKATPWYDGPFWTELVKFFVSLPMIVANLWVIVGLVRYINSTAKAEGIEARH